jgi:hypothetical protein
MENGNTIVIWLGFFKNYTNTFCDLTLQKLEICH